MTLFTPDPRLERATARKSKYRAVATIALESPDFDASRADDLLTTRLFPGVYYGAL